MKLFITGIIDIIKYCQSYFGTAMTRYLNKKKEDKLLSRYRCIEIRFCKYSIVVFEFRTL